MELKTSLILSETPGANTAAAGSCQPNSAEAWDYQHAHDAITVMRRNIKYNDEFFGLFGIALDAAIVRQIIGVGSTIAISLVSLVVSYVVQRFT
jgi:hypothetical protein